MADRTIEVTEPADSTPGAFRLADASGVAPIHRVGTDSVVEVAANDLATDVERVSDRTPPVEAGLPEGGERAVVVGTYGSPNSSRGSTARGSSTSSTAGAAVWSGRRRPARTG